MRRRDGKISAWDGDERTSNSFFGLDEMVQLTLGSPERPEKFLEGREVAVLRTLGK